MKNRSATIVNVLNKLIETNLDRIKGYEIAAEDSIDPGVKNLCTDHALQSRIFRTELEKLVREHHGKPQQSSSAVGAAYRAWMGIKHKTAGNNKKSVLSSCELGEDAAKVNYEEAQRAAVHFPSPVQSAIESQYMAILNAHDKVKSLHDALLQY